MRVEHLRDLVRERVRELRLARGLTQEALCERAGISLDAVTRIERGSRVPTIDTIERLAGALGVAVTDLFGPSSAPRTPKTPAALRRLVALLETEPAEVQDGAEEVVRAVVKTVRAARERPSRRR